MPASVSTHVRSDLSPNRATPLSPARVKRKYFVRHDSRTGTMEVGRLTVPRRLRQAVCSTWDTRSLGLYRRRTRVLKPSHKLAQ
jgi:hypothetical protein